MTPPHPFLRFHPISPGAAFASAVASAFASTFTSAFAFAFASAFASVFASAPLLQGSGSSTHRARGGPLQGAYGS